MTKANWDFHVGRPNVGRRDVLVDRINKIIERKWLTNSGPIVNEFESRLADRLGVRHCVAVSNGTAAIEMVVRGLGLAGEVILPSYTFIASAHALSWMAITPVFCDIDQDTFCINPEKLKSLITPDTSAIMGVHVYGMACDTESLKQISSSYDLPLIFDAAHAVSCSHQGKNIGSFGTCEIFSFHATKVLNTIEGGAITTNDDELADRLRRMRNFGFPGDGREVTVDLGTNAKMNEFCAAMGLTNLESLDEFIAVNKINYQAYNRGLANIAGIRLFEFDQNETNNYQYVIALIDESVFGNSRDALMDALQSQGVLARRYFYPGCHAMEPYLSQDPGAAKRLPVTESVSRQVLALPTGTQLGPPDIEEICDFIRRFQAQR